MHDGWTALMYAAMNGFASIIEILVNHGGADINATDRTHRTALHWACRFNNVAVGRKLMSLGIKADHLDIDNLSAVEVAVRNKNSDV